MLLPRLLLRKTSVSGRAGKDEFARRYRAFRSGDWQLLLDEARAAHKPGPRVDSPQEVERLLEEACTRVRPSEPSRARQMLTSEGLASGSAATLSALTNPERRAKDPLVLLSDELKGSGL